MPDLSLDDLRKEAEARRQLRADKRAPIEDAIERTRLESEIACDDAASAAGLMLGIDCKIVFAENTGKGVLVKRPSELAFQIYTQKVLADKCGPTDRSDFAKQCVACPSWKDFGAIQAETPGMILKVCEVGGNLARAEEAETEGK